MTEYKFTYWNRLEWFHSDCWADAEKTAEKFPQCVEKAKELGQALIDARIKQTEWNKTHPDKFRVFNVELPEPRHINTKKQEDCVETFLAYDIFYKWNENTEEWKKAMDSTKNQINAYFKALADDRDRLADTRDNTKKNFDQFQLNKKVKEAEKLLRR